ncbi:RNA-directed DNA polymerase, eukaryota, reverse transcriptase zinc-binding domain protein, partial [Tanacetum coccineum]
LSVGDRNNAYFHKTIKSRQQRNIIDAVCDENGNRLEGADVADQFVKHFQKFLGESKNVEPISDIGDLLQNKLSNEETSYMIREISDEEIKNAMFQIDNNKAPGPDGFLALFFKKSWNIIGKDVCLADNIMLAQELFKGYDRKMGPKRVALKVDIQKAYDTVNWHFLEDILRGFGFHGKMGRCLRQGDPMSPYLFTLVMEILTLIVKWKVEQNDNFQYHFGCKSVLKKTIDEFGKVVGLIPNYNKSTIIFGCLNEEENQEILEIMPFKVEKLPIRYLGVPLTSKRIRIKECKSLIDKVERRVLNWKNKSLSYAGRLMLVASVLESIYSDGTKGRPKVAWKNVCRFKQKGGLGLKYLGVWNRAMIVKHLWHIVTDKESLWVKWINTEKLKGRSFWKIEEDKNDSWGWRNILCQRNDVRKFIVSKLGDGSKTFVWFDNWSNIGTLDQFINHKTMYAARLNTIMTVRELMGQSNWNWPDAWTEKFPILLDMQNLSLNIQARDKIMWRKRDGSL